MDEFFAPIISSLALTVSIVTAWLTLFRRGTVRMTHPTVIFFGPDGGPRTSRQRQNKIFLRTLLFSTSKRGRIVESIFVRLQRGETQQNFNIWVYGDDSLARGSGLFVGENGVACNHHFLLPEDGTDFQFRPGNYQLSVFAKLVGDARQFELLTINLHITDQIGAALMDPDMGLYFDWGPDSCSYHAHVSSRPEDKFTKLLFETLGNAVADGEISEGELTPRSRDPKEPSGSSRG